MSSTTIPTTEPTTITAGDSLRWDRSFAADGYSAADGWTLTYAHAGPTTFSIAGTTAADGIGFSVTVTYADTANYTPGHYRRTATLTRSATSERKTFAVSDVDVLPNPLATTGDQRTWAERMLEAIEAALEGQDITPFKSLTINGRAIEYLSRAELLKERASYAAMVEREQRAAAPMRFHKVRFGCE